ncbi:MAG TPA: hypothetical protein EYP14_15280 [Planctomycetaceae bacterium]|nr:hypothetical protein [Planctomycetaceae bacterium]
MVDSFDKVLIALAHFVMGVWALLWGRTAWTAVPVRRLIAVLVCPPCRWRMSLAEGLLIGRSGDGRDQMIGSGRCPPLLAPEPIPKGLGNRFSVFRFDL